MQESSDIWPLVRQGSWSLLTAFGRILCITLLGALLGAVLGAGLRFVGAPLTLGSSLFFAPILGAMLGAFVGAFRCVRYFAGLLEALLLYHPRKSRDLSFMEMTWDLADVEYSLQTVSYDLPEVGSQTAYLLRPSGDIDTLWVFFGGNAMLARDWLMFCDKVLTHTSRTTNAFLLVDYPGYGRNAGEPSPASVLKSSHLALEATLEKLPTVQVQLLGHSLGAAAAAQLAADWDLPSGPGLLVLSAPFIDIPHMAVQLLSVLLSTGLPKLYAVAVDVLPFQEQTLEKLLPSSGSLATLGRRLKPWLVSLLWPIVPHRWDNGKSVRQATKAGWKIHVLHGAQDELIPSQMGQTLANLSQKEASKLRDDAFSEIPRAGHNDVVLKGFERYMELMGLTDANPSPPSSRK
ncbi:unnamed protein product [Cladocopium goreaui]|uniref:AB hydrolase-1 domain-containing protein n=1 Tax=Cladocopium goreaui TaxID=2562237 RepID=A0A9P1GP04_9DINO|nr:unnamed protein product [Cladocopium goreaui]